MAGCGFSFLLSFTVCYYHFNVNVSTFNRLHSNYLLNNAISKFHFTFSFNTLPHDTTTNTKRFLHIWTASTVTPVNETTTAKNFLHKMTMDENFNHIPVKMFDCHAAGLYWYYLGFEIKKCCTAYVCVNVWHAIRDVVSSIQTVKNYKKKKRRRRKGT